MPMNSTDEGSEAGTDEQTATRLAVARRTVLRAAGATTALGLGATTAAADEHTGTDDGPGADDGEGGGGGDDGEGGDGGMPAELDPLFGYASADPNPCGGEAGAECFEAFAPPIRPSHEVEMNIDLPGALLAIGEQGALSDVTTQSINESVADGTVERETLHRPDAAVDFETPEGTQTLTVAAIAGWSPTLSVSTSARPDSASNPATWSCSARSRRTTPSRPTTNGTGARTGSPTAWGHSRPHSSPSAATGSTGSRRRASTTATARRTTRSGWSAASSSRRATCRTRR
ncbi:hypothetical protein GJ632_18345 [Halogeometricum sp. CBA1124]|nr:hypothetical protein [Halogeometricum sp. CBA1124]MUV58783.1 hypothetical protein [Halogeometricum sp. CBA1124]